MSPVLAMGAGAAPAYHPLMGHDGTLQGIVAPSAQETTNRGSYVLPRLPMVMVHAEGHLPRLAVTYGTDTALVRQERIIVDLVQPVPLP